MGSIDPSELFGAARSPSYEFRWVRYAEDERAESSAAPSIVMGSGGCGGGGEGGLAMGELERASELDLRGFWVCTSDD
jgi:hypothetical protein